MQGLGPLYARKGRLAGRAGAGSAARVRGAGYNNVASPIAQNQRF
ncbi:hypothetical protein GCM10027395_27130 [Giesbergeria sinuosa]